MRAALIAAVALLVAGTASAEDPIRFRQHYPAWIATNYSTSDDWQKENAPYLKAQASMAMSLLRAPAKIGPVVFDPSLAFTFRSINWPVGKSSSPMEENNYLPEAFVRFNEDEGGYWRGGRIGWLHSSTGTDSSSGSIDRVLLESKFGYEFIIGQNVVELSGYARGWYTVSTGAETAGIEKYINFALWEDAGGELMVIAEADGIGRAVVTLGLSYQVYEVYLPLADAYDIDLFGQLHHGNADGIVDYADRHTSGGVGLALVR